jgi:uncharacterized protein
VEFGWDPAKHAKTRQEHGFGFDYAARIFAGPTFETIDRRRDYGDEQTRAIGEIDSRIFVVIYTGRSKICWIISAWKASGKDIRQWQNRA